MFKKSKNKSGIFHFQYFLPTVFVSTVFVCMRVCMYVYVYVCMYVYGKSFRETRVSTVEYIEIYVEYIV